METKLRIQTDLKKSGGCKKEKSKIKRKEKNG